jgi:hypothetical protein
MEKVLLSVCDLSEDLGIFINLKFHTHYHIA